LAVRWSPVSPYTLANKTFTHTVTRDGVEHECEHPGRRDPDCDKPDRPVPTHRRAVPVIVGQQSLMPDVVPSDERSFPWTQLVARGSADERTA
jgi:hypothetical protein